MPVANENVNSRTEKEVVNEDGSTKRTVTMEHGNPSLMDEAHYKLEVTLSFQGEKVARGESRSTGLPGVLQGGRNILQEIALQAMADIDALRAAQQEA